MASKFSEFLSENKIDARRLLLASRQIERLKPEDRRLKLQRRKTKKPEGSEGAAATEKPRSGRPVTPRLLDDVSKGKPVSGPAKTRLLRAVNRVLEQKQKDPVDLRRLF